MALTPILAVPRKPVEEKEENPLRTLLTDIGLGLKVANEGFGIAVNYKKLDEIDQNLKLNEQKMVMNKQTMRINDEMAPLNMENLQNKNASIKAQSEMLNRQNRGILNPTDVATLGLIPRKGGQEFSVKDPNTGAITVGEYETPAQTAERNKAINRALEQKRIKAQSDLAVSLKKMELEAKKNDKSYDRETKMREQWNKDPITQTTKTAYNSLKKVTTAAGLATPAGDMSLIFAYMKLLDPTSAVREGEQASAAATRGIIDDIRMQYNKAINGVKLTAKQRSEFIKATNELYNEQIKMQKRFDVSIKGMADRNRLDFRNIWIDFGQNDEDLFPDLNKAVIDPNSPTKLPLAPRTNSKTYNTNTSTGAKGYGTLGADFKFDIDQYNASK